MDSALFFEVVLVTATLLCSLVSGFLFAFAVIAMPGLGRLGDGAFLRAFQEMDGLIQNNQPLFMTIWGGSVLTLLAAGVLGGVRLDGLDRVLVVGAAAVYLLGVQGITAGVNVPLNNALQRVDLGAENAAGLRSSRSAFEAQWNRANVIRTVLAVVASVMLLVALVRL